jgi:hypothetical protein
MQRNTILVVLLCLAVALPASGLAQTTTDPAKLLEQAHSEIATSHLYSADAILRDVMKSPDASVAQVQEALSLQCMIYAGDVLGAALLIQPLGKASVEGSGLKGEVSKQLVLARHAFAIAANDYLNATVMGAELKQLKLTLPNYTQADVTKLENTLASPADLKAMLDGYSKDPTPGQGLMTRANQYGFFLAFSAAVPGSLGQNPDNIRAKVKQGVTFDNLNYLDWIARVALDMHHLLKEPNGPDLTGLAQRADERILKLAQADSPYAKAARSRAGKYK